MHKKGIYITIAVVVVIIGFFFIHKNKPSATPDSLSASITVTSLSADVFIKEPNVEEKKLDDKAVIALGSSIRTSSTGRAFIEAPDKKITLDSGSEIMIPADQEAYVSSITLLTGSVWSQVEKVFEKGQFYEVKTQNSVATVRGTAFKTTYENGTTTVLVSSSTVAVTPLDKETGEPLEDETVLIPAGKKAIQGEDSKIEVKDLTDEEKNSDWYKETSSEVNVNVSVGDVNGDGTAEVKADPKPTTPTPTPTEPTKPTPTEPVEPKPTEPVASALLGIKGVMPARIEASSRETITLSGSGFLHAVALSIGEKALNPTEVPNFKVVNDTTITFTLPSGLSAGTYNVVIVDDRELGTTLSKSLTLY